MEERPASVNLEGLIRQVEKEGIERGQREAERLVADARAEAGRILEAAQAEARQRVEEGEAKLRRQEEAGRRALQQAARDLLLGVRNSLGTMLQNLVEQECRERLTGPLLEELMLKAAQAWLGAEQKRAGSVGGLEVWLSAEDCRRLEGAFMDRMRQALAEGVELRPHPGIRAGFRVGAKGGGYQWDFTDQALAEVLGEYLGGRWANLLDPAVQPNGGDPG